MADSDTVKRASFRLMPVLLVVFIVLKLCDLIHWSWVWVLAPLWLGSALFISVWVIAFAGAYVFYTIQDIFKRK